MTFSLSGEFQPARSTVFPLALCGAAAVGALGRESFTYSRELSAVYVFVARLTQGHTVGDIVTQRLMVFPRLDVVRLNCASCAALLAGVIVSGVHGIAPLAVFVGIALLVGVLLSFGCVAAILAAVLSFELPVGGVKRFAAPLTGKIRFRSIFTPDFIGALSGACFCFFAVPYCGLELLTADNARRLVTGVTVPFARVIRLVFRATDGALNAPDYLRRNGCYFGVLTAKPSFALNFLGTSRVWTKFACCHTPIIPGYGINRKLQRWATHTGQSPVLLGDFP